MTINAVRPVVKYALAQVAAFALLNFAYVYRDALGLSERGMIGVVLVAVAIYGGLSALYFREIRRKAANPPPNRPLSAWPEK